MKVHQIQGGPFYLRLENAKVIFHPSAYGGTGDEVRLGFVLSVGEDNLKHIREIEENLHEQINSKANWNSSIKESDKYEPSFRSKVN